MDVLFISEVSSNHNRDLDRCFQFIDQSSRIGCYAIKFQLFRINELFSPQILNKSKKHREREKWELPLEILPRLAARCHEKNIKFACTPFYLKAVEQLYPYIDFYKIFEACLMPVAGPVMGPIPGIMTQQCTPLQPPIHALAHFLHGSGINLR